MRERPTDDAVNAVFLRITPARAGKTSSTILSGHIQQDHPRSCGKDKFSAVVAIILTGSPPLVRERHANSAVAKLTGGITPARAGKTEAPPVISFYNGDHPRSCGKDGKSRKSVRFSLGSPPLVRERLSRLFPDPERSRITPARAGKTASFLLSASSQRDHPRSCGKDLLAG